MKRVVVPFFISHLGCPHRCVFCNQEKIAGAGGILPRAEEIRVKVEQYLATSNAKEVEAAFYGGTFTALPLVDQQYLLGALQPLISSGCVGSVRVSTRPDAVDPSIASFLKEMRVETVELGVQSMDEHVLAASRRGHTARDVECAVGILQEAGLAVGIQLMTGLPGDTPEKSLGSLQRVLALGPSFLRIYPALVISGTDLAGLYQSGVYHPQSLDEAVTLCKRMLREARRASVPVIRTGLQPTAELESPGVLLAGPYHPAFGQLVESELFYDLMATLAAPVPSGSRVALSAPPGRLSDVVGQKRRNVARLAEHFAVSVVSVREDTALKPTGLALEWEGGKTTGDLLDL